MDELAQTIITILSSEVEEMRIAVGKFVDAYSALTDWYWEWMLERKNRRKARFRRKLKRLENKKARFFQSLL